eukprot:gb/GECH01008422.1/.p1 GENE.gb/GECH01008422.1/~~gb/GECH01008422.1/.p1  ORF type:complete len:199 (+),score=81.58 gb/GECH01008422.1/:1-597(+)
MNSWTLDEEFQYAVDYIKNAPPENIKLTDEEKLKIYALFKQSTEGSCNTKRPGMFDFTGRAKWDSWNSLGSMSSNEAKQEYIQELDRISPQWRGWIQSHEEQEDVFYREEDKDEDEDEDGAVVEVVEVEVPSLNKEEMEGDQDEEDEEEEEEEDEVAEDNAMEEREERRSLVWGAINAGHRNRRNTTPAAAAAPARIS